MLAGSPVLAAEVRPGIGLGLGALPSNPSAVLILPKLDVQVEGGDRSVSFFAAARFGTFVIPRGGLFAPSIEAGARWHPSERITFGLAAAAGLAVSYARGGATRFTIGATVELFTFSLSRHQEVGLAASAMVPASAPPIGATGPLFDVLILPTLGYTYRL